jgi:hypothetical protein
MKGETPDGGLPVAISVIDAARAKLGEYIPVNP